MQKRYFHMLLLGLIFSHTLCAKVYHGRIVDTHMQGIGYATIYPQQDPVLGTASNNDGLFAFTAELDDASPIIVSFIGYEKQSLPAALLCGEDTATIVLHEQPIALEETVVAAHQSKQKNRRKQLASLLHAVYVKMQQEFADQPSAYQVVSDVRMDGSGEPWGMEQMIARIVVLPEAGHNANDSVQFAGRYCKRFFRPDKRAAADTILAGNGLDRIDKQMRKAANAVDSGVVVHRSLFAWGNMRYDFEQAVNDLRHWTVSNESEGETVLTHTEKISKYLGCLKLVTTRHYIVDSDTYAVRRFSEHMDIDITIPFGIRLDREQLQLLNLFNMGQVEIDKFRLRHISAKIDFNTIYQRRDGKLYILEKNLQSNALIQGSQHKEIPLTIHATQRTTNLQTEGVHPMPRHEITRRVKRQIVEIY